MSAIVQRLLVALFCATVISVEVVAAEAAAQASAAETYELNIDSQPLAEALKSFAQATGLQVMFFAEVATGLKAPPVKGRLTRDEAMERLLEGSGLSYRNLNAGTVAVSAGGVNRKSMNQVPHDTVQVAQADTSAQKVEGDSPSAESVPLDEVVVTGSHIRGSGNSTSSVKTFTRGDIEKTGVSSIADFLDRLPQNFSSEGKDRSVSTGGGNNQNAEAANGINLRGLGPQGTLVLLNGHRLAPGVHGDFVDVSFIPLAAVERVEILTDGASAIYGSDAVAGVVNFILRDDYQGAESRVKVGRSASSDAWQGNLNQLLGTSWASGNALISANYARQDPLHAGDRSYSSSVPEPTYLVPDDHSYNIMLAASQRATESIKLFGDLIYSNRDVSDVGTYDFQPTFFSDLNVKQIAGSGGASMALGGGWDGTLTVSGAENKLRANYAQPEFAFSSVDSARARIGSAELSANGPVFELPGGAMGLAVGASARDEKYDRLDTGFAAEGFPPDRVRRDVKAIFSELSVPIIGVGNSRPGFRRLMLSLAGRYEEYSDAGDTFDPKFGLLWQPIDQLRVRGTYATSFSTARYRQAIVSFNSLVVRRDTSTACGGTTCLLLTESGNRPTYDPETSESFNAGIDFRSERIKGFQVSLDYYNIKYKDRIALPPGRAQLLANPAQLQQLPEIAQASPSVEFVQDFLTRCASAPQCSNRVGDFDLAAVDYYLDLRTRNLTATRTSGIDLDTRYTLSSQMGEWRFGLAGSYVFDLVNKVTPIAPDLDVIDTYGNPVKHRLVASVDYQRPALEVSTFLNYIGSYRNTLATPSTAIDSWVTLDMRVAVPVSSWLPSLKEGSEVALSVLNVGNSTPPSALNTDVPIGFDPANSDPFGRTVALELVARW